MTTGAALLDIDGTLVDSNYLPVAAWFRGFRAVGEDVASSAIHRSIGMGSPQLLALLLGRDKADRLGERVTEVTGSQAVESAKPARPR